MSETKRLVDFKRRAAEARKIAQGIFDHKERKVVLDLVSDAEKLAEKLRSSS